MKENLTFSGDSSSMANLLLSVMGAFAEFERDIPLRKKDNAKVFAKQKSAELIKEEGDFSLKNQKKSFKN